MYMQQKEYMIYVLKHSVPPLLPPTCCAVDRMYSCVCWFFVPAATPLTAPANTLRALAVSRAAMPV